MAEFEIETDEGERATLIKLRGELDSETAGAVLEQFDRAAASGTTAVVLDLSDVEFIDSAGLRAIIVIEQQAGARGVALTVVPPSPPLLELLEVTGLAERLSLSEDGAGQRQAERFLERVEFRLPRDPSAPRLARAELRATFADTIPEMDLATALLLTSELVTNAVLHPEGGERDPVEVRITCFPERFRVEVLDRGKGFDPTRVPDRPPETGGRGLMVVDRLAARWGTTDISADGERRFCVWYELDIRGTKS